MTILYFSWSFIQFLKTAKIISALQWNSQSSRRNNLNLSNLVFLHQQTNRQQDDVRPDSVTFERSSEIRYPCSTILSRTNQPSSNVSSQWKSFWTRTSVPEHFHSAKQRWNKKLSGNPFDVILSHSRSSFSHSFTSGQTHRFTSRSTSLCPVGLELKKGDLSLSLSTGQCPGCVFFSQRANSNPSLVCSQFPTKLVFFTSLVIFLMGRVVDFHYKQCSNPSFVCSQFPTNFKKINGEITCIFSKTNFARICVQSYIILYFYWFVFFWENLHIYDIW